MRPIVRALLGTLVLLAMSCSRDEAAGGCPGAADRTSCTLAAGSGWCQAGVCEALAACATNDDCVDDTRCDGANCRPWAASSPAFDATCRRPIPTGIFSPTLVCEFSTAPAGDPFPGHVDVQSTPLVASFSDAAEPAAASIVAAFSATVVGAYTEELGVIRVLRGDDCSVEANLGGTDVDADAVVDWIVSVATPAIGDLDGDGVPEIVAYGADGSTLAFTRKLGAWGLLWKAAYPAGVHWSPCSTVSHSCAAGWAGPSLHDLDDDGVPEVLREGVVFRGSDGALLTLDPAAYEPYLVGLFGVAADVDGDGKVELTNGQFLWEAGTGPIAWSVEPYFSPVSASGHTAIADLGPYGASLAAGTPELVFVRSGVIGAFALDGTLPFGPISIPGAGFGGPPTVADFDGDGLAEIVTPGRGALTAYDLDCGPAPRTGGVCNLGTCDYAGGSCPVDGFIAWSRATQEMSSSLTSAVAFDFEADGSAEAVYADECFTRIYGAGGAVLASRYRSSCTWMENPIVADTNGDARAELVVPSNRACAASGQGPACTAYLNPDGVDALFAGQPCASGAECGSGICDGGFCRCTSTAQCCGSAEDAACLEAGVACAPPSPATPGSGNTCRASRPHGLSGIRVFADANDNWVGARPIWNQHPYSVTAVSDDGTIPRTSAWAPSWTTAAGNGFRMNVPGTPDGRGAGDATVAPGAFACSAGAAVLSAPICNRGSEPMAAGLAVEFRAGVPLACRTTTTLALEPGDCQTVSCSWSAPPTSRVAAIEVTVVANASGVRDECWTGNGAGRVPGVVCPP